MPHKAVFSRSSWIVDQRAMMVAVYPAPPRHCLCPTPPGTLFCRIWSDEELKEDPDLPEKAVQQANETLRAMLSASREFEQKAARNALQSSGRSDKFSHLTGEQLEMIDATALHVMCDDARDDEYVLAVFTEHLKLIDVQARLDLISTDPDILIDTLGFDPETGEVFSGE